MKRGQDHQPGSGRGWMKVQRQVSSSPELRAGHEDPPSEHADLVLCLTLIFGVRTQKRPGIVMPGRFFVSYSRDNRCVLLGLAVTYSPTS